MSLTIVTREREFSISSVQSSNKIAEVKRIIQDAEGIAARNQRLFLGNKELKDNSKVEEHEIEEGARIALFLAE